MLKLLTAAAHRADVWSMVTHVWISFFVARALTSHLYIISDFIVVLQSMDCALCVCVCVLVNGLFVNFCFRQIIMWINSNNHRDAIVIGGRWTHVKGIITMITAVVSM